MAARSIGLIVTLIIVIGACGGQPSTEAVVTQLLEAESVTIDTSETAIVVSDPLNSEATCTISEEPTLGYRRQ